MVNRWLFFFITFLEKESHRNASYMKLLKLTKPPIWKGNIANKIRSVIDLPSWVLKTFEDKISSACLTGNLHLPSGEEVFLMPNMKLLTHHLWPLYYLI